MLTSSSSFTSLSTAAAESSILLPSPLSLASSLASSAVTVPPASISSRNSAMTAFVAPPSSTRSSAFGMRTRSSNSNFQHTPSLAVQELLSLTPPLMASWQQQDSPTTDITDQKTIQQLPATADSSFFVPSHKSLRYKLLGSSTATASTSSQTSIVPAVVGHRGALYDCLENTREGFIRCAELGAAAVELDVFVLRDNTVVVFHGSGTDENPGDLSDYCLLNTFNNNNNNNKRSSTSILDLDYAETQQLQFNPDFAEFPCPADAIRAGRIPTLQQVLLDLQQPYYDTNTNSIEIKIELKGPGTVEPVLEIVERLQMQDQCSYSSFDLQRLALLHSLRPTYRTGALFVDVPPEDFIAQAQAVGASEIHLKYDECTVERVAAIHEAGFNSMAWFRGPMGMTYDTVHKYWDMGNEDAAYQAVIDTGVQQLCCNKPAELLQLLRANNQQQETPELVNEAVV